MKVEQHLIKAIHFFRIKLLLSSSSSFSAKISPSLFKLFSPELLPQTDTPRPLREQPRQAGRFQSPSWHRSHPVRIESRRADGKLSQYIPPSPQK